MRILFVTQWFEPEPGAICGLPLARWLRQQGHEVAVVTGFPNYPSGRIYEGYRVRWRHRETMDGVPVLRVPLYPSHDGSPIRRAANYGSFALSAAVIGTALSGPADVGYCYHPPATVGLPAVAMKLFRGIPFVYHIEDMWPESVVESGMLGQGWKQEAIRNLLSGWCSFVYRRASRIIVLSPGFKRLLIDRGVAADKIDIVYNWVQEEVFKPLPRDGALQEELGLRGRFNVIYAGNLGAFQGLATVIRAAQRVEDVPEIQVVLAGTGQDESQLKALACALGLKNVRFLGPRPYRDMPRINALADVMLVHLKDLPFFATTIPSKTQVALASGRPVLMAVRGDAADVIERAGAGLVCEPEDEAALADRILRLYRLSADELEEMGRKGREFYLREMSLDVGGRLMVESFRLAIGGSPARVGRAGRE
jgi:putative colanic acid biosynthesis glycosyltransferase WcaI